jgi:hypothetical protein
MEPGLQLIGGQLNINFIGGGHLGNFCLVWDESTYFIGGFLGKTISIGGPWPQLASPSSVLTGARQQKWLLVDNKNLECIFFQNQTSTYHGLMVFELQNSHYELFICNGLENYNTIVRKNIVL